MFPVGDKSPTNYSLPRPSFVELVIKRPIRRFLYPLYGVAIDRWLRKKYGWIFPFPVDRWLWGQRGNDFESHRRYINSLRPLRGSAILVAGCGTGRDVGSWLAYSPATVTGIDYFRYDRAWQMLQEDVRKKSPAIQLDFHQGDIANLMEIDSRSVDVVGSDAVFEHVKDLSGVLKESWRILRPGGLIYATFGPLWYCWGGDHLSGYDGIASGYNHLLLLESEYKAYLDAMGPYTHSEHDGRTWVANGLFSYLRPAQYLDGLAAAGFRRKHVAMILEPRAVKCLGENPALQERLLVKHGELDLVTTGMTVIYEKPGYPS